MDQHSRKAEKIRAFVEKEYRWEDGDILIDPNAVILEDKKGYWVDVHLYFSKHEMGIETSKEKKERLSRQMETGIRDNSL